MIDWIVFDRAAPPPPNGWYLVYCVAPQFDSSWVDVARIDDGMWHNFNSQMSAHIRVRYYAKLNYPPENVIEVEKSDG